MFCHRLIRNVVTRNFLGWNFFRLQLKTFLILTSNYLNIAKFATLSTFGNSSHLNIANFATLFLFDSIIKIFRFLLFYCTSNSTDICNLLTNILSSTCLTHLEKATVGAFTAHKSTVSWVTQC